MNMETSATLAVTEIMMIAMVHSTISETTTATESIGEADGCPANPTWISKSRSCYLLVSEKLNFTQAKKMCQGLGAHLVSINSEEENLFIRDLSGTSNLPGWIGLYRPTNEFCAGSSCGNWMWLDGSVLQYSQWVPGVSDTSNQCVFMDSQGDWDHGRRCSAQNGYVCEQQRIFPSTTQDPSTMMSTSDIIHPTSSNAEGNLVSITDITEGIKDSSIFIGVGVSTATVAISAFVGLSVYYMKTRRTEKRNSQASRRIPNIRGDDTDTAVYENSGPDARDDPSQYQSPTHRMDVQLNTLSGQAEDIRTSNDAEHTEDNPAYEEIHNYLEMNPEYTPLQVAHSADIHVESNTFYANV